MDNMSDIVNLIMSGCILHNFIILCEHGQLENMEPESDSDDSSDEEETSDGVQRREEIVRAVNHQ
jgi:hypothetical protein